KKGEIFAAWMKHIIDFVAANKDAAGLETEFAIYNEAMRNYNEALKVMTGLFATPGMAQTYATRVLHATGKIWAGKLLLEMALIAQKKIDEIGKDNFDYTFYAGKVASARFYIKNIMPDLAAFLEVCKNADDTCIEVAEEIFYV
ncbi:MAG: acyl-CoA dehydrogenase, partial [Syntrophomonadaceae bacterium]|nr:acyl-CoA dehydrogenase [Syntrophomonadaceae bacterium]